MKPGRELDALVAQRVMGIRVTHEQGEYWPPPRPGANFATQPIREYSYDIAAAWEVVKKLQTPKQRLAISLNRNGGCWVEVVYFNPKTGAIDRWSAKAKSAPHAICLAALKAVGALTDKEDE